MPSATLAQWGRGERLRRAIGVYRFLVDGTVAVILWLTKSLVGICVYLSRHLQAVVTVFSPSDRLALPAP
jgi:hypothetical protein